MFERERRYLIIKSSDLHAQGVVSAPEKSVLHGIIQAVTAYRKKRGKGELQCVVVESDWPEYEMVWQMLEHRVATEGMPEGRLVDVLGNMRITKREYKKQKRAQIRAVLKAIDEMSMGAAGLDAAAYADFALMRELAERVKSRLKVEHWG